MQCSAGAGEKSAGTMGVRGYFMLFCNEGACDSKGGWVGDSGLPVRHHKQDNLASRKASTECMGTCEDTQAAGFWVFRTTTRRILYVANEGQKRGISMAESRYQYITIQELENLPVRVFLLLLLLLLRKKVPFPKSPVHEFKVHVLRIFCCELDLVPSLRRIMMIMKLAQKRNLTVLFPPNEAGKFS